MEFQSVVRRRRMVRAFEPERPVPAAVLARVLDAGIRAPTAGFSQGVEFLVLGDEPGRSAFWAATADSGEQGGDRGSGNRWLLGMRTAPVLVIVFIEEDRYRMRYAEADKPRADQDPDKWSAPFWFVDAGMAAHAMLLAAVNEGLGACFFGIPAARVPDVIHTWKVPSTHRPVGVLAIGYPAAESGARGSAHRSRRPRHEVVHMDTWPQPT